MTTNRLGVSDADLDRLERSPGDVVTGRFDGVSFEIRVAIADYARRMDGRYAPLPHLNGSAPALDFRHFGLLCSFSYATELTLYEDDFVLDDGVREMVRRFGPVIFANAYLTLEQRATGQRNIFPSLVFHFDRGPMHKNRYSLFCRDPFDPVQREPRGSSTLILPNRAVYLESLLEGAAEHEFRAQYTLFRGERLSPLIDDILIEQRWDTPAGTGEVCVFDNRNVMHASYYAHEAGYPIGVRYLF